MCVRGIGWDKPESEKTSEGDRALEDCEGLVSSAARLSFAPACSLFFRRCGLSHLSVAQSGLTETPVSHCPGPREPLAF